VVASSPAEALSLAASGGAAEAVVIGGSAVFERLLPRCDTVYLTIVEGIFEGDVFFPVTLLDSPDWEVIEEQLHPADARNPFATRFRILSRRKPAAQ
jgi:dihydrofolate reductase